MGSTKKNKIKILQARIINICDENYQFMLNIYVRFNPVLTKHAFIRTAYRVLMCRFQFFFFYNRAQTKYPTFRFNNTVF